MPREAQAASPVASAPPADIGARRQLYRSTAEKLLNLLHDLDEAIDLLRRVVKIKTRARGRLDAQLVHQRLVAMMSAAQRDAALVRQFGHVVGMDAVQEKAHESGAADIRAEQPDV